MKKLILLLTIIYNLYGDDSFHFIMENDFINDTDRHLTNTMTASWMFDLNDSFANNFSLSITQDIFTPEDIKEEDKTKYDMPYAGHLYTNLNLYFQNKSHMQTVGIQIGKIGEKAYAKEVQTEVHKVIGASQPVGWKNQLQNKNTYGVNYTFTSKTPRVKTYFNELDMNTIYQLNMGNYNRSYAIGLSLRYGDNFPDSYHGFNSQVNLTKTKGWSITGTIFLAYADYMYILDDFKDEYNINRSHLLMGNSVNLDLFNKSSVITFKLTTMHISLDNKLLTEQWFGFGYTYIF